MTGTKKAREGLMDAVAKARDETLVEIGREAAARQAQRVVRARRRKMGKVALAAVAAGAALTAGALAVRRHRAKAEPIPLNGQPEPPK